MNMKFKLASMAIAAILVLSACGPSAEQAQAELERKEAADHFKDMKYTKVEAVGAISDAPEKTKKDKDTNTGSASAKTGN